MRYVIIFVLLLTFTGCSQNQGTNTYFEETPKEDFSSLKNSELKEAIFSAARKSIPIDTTQGFAYGVLDKNLTETTAHVGYYNEEIFEIYLFKKNNQEWERTNKIVSEVFIPKTAKSKQKTYTKAIAKIYTGPNRNTLRDTWYVPGNQQANGDWIKFEEYVSNRPNRVDFIEGDEIDPQSDEDHTISFKGPWTYSNEINDSTETKTDYLYEMDGNVEITYEDSVYYSSKLVVEYSHDIVVIEVPSKPTLSYPTNQGYTYQSVTYNWNESSGNGTMTYHIQVSTDSTFNSIFYQNPSISSTSINVTQHGYGTQYFWRVRASNEAGDSDWSAVRSFTTRPDSPSVTGSVDNGHPKLSWSNTDGAVSYEIYKRVDTTNWQLYATTSSTSYIDTLTDVTGYQGTVMYNTPYVTYYVRAIAVNDAWNNEPSEHYYDPDGVSPHSIGGIEF